MFVCCYVYNTYLGGEKTTAGRYSEYVEHGGADDSADPEISMCHEGANDVDKKLGARRGHRHECRTGNIFRHADFCS